MSQLACYPNSQMSKQMMGRRAHDSLNSPSTVHFLAPSLSLHYLDNRAVSLTSGICYGTVSEKLQSLVVASLFFILFTYA